MGDRVAVLPTFYFGEQDLCVDGVAFTGRIIRLRSGYQNKLSL